MVCAPTTGTRWPPASRTSSSARPPSGWPVYWSTPPVPEPPTTLELCQFDPGTHLIGAVYLGWPADQQVVTPVRPPVELLHVPA